MYSSTLSFHSALDGSGWSRSRSGRFTSRTIIKVDEQPLGIQLYKNNDSLSYMFRPSRGHLQVDIWNTSGSLQTISIYDMYIS